MNSLVIVAIPSEDDYVNKISSEKVPHLTLLYLGEDVTKVKNLSKILEYVEHASKQSLERFGLEVDRRSELGDEKADVLLFSKSKFGGFKQVNEFRSFLLKDNNIRTAYDSSKQFSEWLPHLTLGYPDTPAKADERDYPGITYVNFDRIAVWFGDYEGVEFPLKSHNWESEMAMSDTNAIVQNILKHVGVKGMKWGVRKDRAVDTFVSRGLGISTDGNRKRSATITVTDKRKKLKTSGGRGLPAHPDAVKAHVIGRKAKGSGVKALSNEELQTYTRRLQLEQNLSNLNRNTQNAGAKFAAGVGKRVGNKAVDEVLNEASRSVRRNIHKRMK